MANNMHIFFGILVMVACATFTCTGKDGVGDGHVIEFIFNIPYIVNHRDHAPHVAMTTSSSEPVFTTLTIPGYGYEVHNTITRDNPADVRLWRNATGFDVRIHSDDENAHKKTIILRASSDDLSVSAMDNDDAIGDAFTILSTVDVGTTYYVSTYNPIFYSAPSVFTISTFLPDTSVNIIRPSGRIHQVKLEKYMSYRLDGDYREDLSGTFVQSNVPVTVIAGTYTQVPTGVDYPDGMVEQLPPIRSWGYKFTLTPFLTLSSGFVYRVFTATNPATLRMSNGDITHIESETFYEDDVTGDTVVSFTSDEPVMVAQYMKGADANTLPGVGTGDPSMVIVPPMKSKSSLTTSSTTFYVLKYLFRHTYYVNAVIDCKHVDGLLLDGSSFMDVTSPIIMSPDGSSCCLRSLVSTGHHSVISDSKRPFFLIVYAICHEGCHSSYAFSVSTPGPVDKNTTNNTAGTTAVVVVVLGVLMTIAVAATVLYYKRIRKNESEQVDHNQNAPSAMTRPPAKVPNTSMSHDAGMAHDNKGFADLGGADGERARDYQGLYSEIPEEYEQTVFPRKPASTLAATDGSKYYDDTAATHRPTDDSEYYDDTAIP